MTISRDTESIVEAVKQFVTTFNDVIGRIDDYDYYNVDTEEKGVLLGNATAANVRSALYRVATGRALNVDTSFQYLTQVGIGINSDGELTFDEAAFREVYGDDPQAIENLFAAYDITSSTTEEIGEGITVESDDITYNSLGFGNLFDRLLEELTDSIDGTMTRAEDAFQDQIDLLNSRIEDIDVRLEARRAQLTREFAAMEMALARLQAQSNSLASITSLVSLSSS